MRYTRLAEALGIKGRDVGVQRYSRCPLHSDNNPSFSLNLQTGAWTCHVGCGPDTGRDFPALVALIRDCTYWDALTWMRSAAPFEASNADLYSEIQRLLNTRPAQDPQVEQYRLWYESLDKTVLPAWFLRRGFTWKTVEEYGIRYDGQGDAVALPIHNWDGDFVGVTLRYSNPGNRGKYWNSPGFAKGSHLYPFGPQDDSGPIIITEGQLDAIWLRQNGIRAACSFGMELSQDQIALLKRGRIAAVYIGYDNDVHGEEGANKAARALMKAGWPLGCLRRIDWPNPENKPKIDANDCSPEQITNAIAHARMVV